jgi:hypothetical protein
MSVILPVDHIPDNFEIVNRHVIRVALQPFKLVHHVEFPVSCLRGHRQYSSCLSHIFIFDFVFTDAVRRLILTIHTNIPRIIFFVMFFVHFERRWNFTVSYKFELAVFNYVLSEILYFVRLQFALEFNSDLRCLEETSDVKSQYIRPIEYLEVTVVNNVVHLYVFDLLVKIVFLRIHECFYLVFKYWFMSFSKFCKL